MMDATQHRKAATRLISFAAVGLLLEGNLSLYQLEAILICWLVFSLAFVSLALLILAVIFVFYAGECVIHWASTGPTTHIDSYAWSFRNLPGNEWSRRKIEVSFLQSTVRKAARKKVF